MGKSSSCFKLITCGGDDSADKDDYEVVSEIKDSNDKRGWSFRKRSVRHRVLSNTVITETPSSVNKESSELTSINFQPLAEPNVVEKTYTTNFSGEKPQLSSLASSQVSEIIVTRTESKVDVNQPESVVIIIQAAIRGFLAQRALLKSKNVEKNVVKLQAAVRGHLVRRHAVGTLRCVQAIVKMQVLVRARRAQQSRSQNHLNHKDGQNDCSKTLGNEYHVMKSNVTCTSIEKLLSNRFARQLLESTPKTKAIHVKCDPSKADSAWKWLERWMSVSSTDSAEYKKSICMSEQSDITKDSSFPSEVFLQSADSKPIVGDSPLPSEDEEKMTSYGANNFTFEGSPCTSSLVKDNLEQAPLEMAITDDAKVSSSEIDSFQNESAPEKLSSLPQKPEIDGEQCKLETEGKNFVHVSRNFSNPAFLAAQSKFEELSSMENSGRSGSLSNQDAPVESQADMSSVATDTAYGSAPYPSRIGGSEVSPELSISSTLDSPDRSEVGAKDLVEGIGNPGNKIDHGVATPTSNIPSSDLDQLEIVDDISGDMVHSVAVGDSEEKNAPDLLREQAEAVLQDLKLSPEASPRTHMTIPESQGTPSSQVSMKTNKTGSSNRRRVLSWGNKSPANTNHDSSSRGSRKQQPKDQSSGKRRNSSGSVKHDHVDQEPRDNASNNSSLPRFMQATESARAKVNANNSPRSSPDVHDQDTHVKKRHSLPGATGRQGSPRMEPTSQAQQSTKGNVLQTLHERKWQR